MSDVPPGYEQQPGGYAPPATSSAIPPGRPLTIIAFVLAGIALLFLPPILGLVGVILSVIAMGKGDPLARWSLIASIAGGAIGMVIAFAVLSAGN